MMIGVMGEMADMLIDSAFEEMWGEHDDGFGPMYYSPRPRKTRPYPTCKYCSKSNLRWGRIDNRWMLHEVEGNIHNCPLNPLSLDVLRELMLRKRKKHGQLLPIPSWDETFMHEVYWWARRSKDPSTQVGAVIVLPEDRDPISFGYNGFARKVNDDVSERWDRPEKYLWVSHAESNAILKCPRNGRVTKGAIMFTSGIPCTDCANDIIQAGIVEVVVHQQWLNHELDINREKWLDSAKRSKEKFREAKINIRIFDKVLGMQCLMNGKVIEV